jgi:Fe-S-cluster containining protein
VSELDCQTCGACCLGVAWNSFPVVPFADMSMKDAKRIEDKHPGSVVMHQPQGMSYSAQLPMMNIKDDPRGRCVALSGTIGRKVACRIYEDRPKGCARFKPGSEKCLEIRARFGIDKKAKGGA